MVVFRCKSDSQYHTLLQIHYDAAGIAPMIFIETLLKTVRPILEYIRHIYILFVSLKKASIESFFVRHPSR